MPLFFLSLLSSPTHRAHQAALLGFHSNPTRASLMADLHHRKLLDLAHPEVTACDRLLVTAYGNRHIIFLTSMLPLFPPTLPRPTFASLTPLAPVYSSRTRTLATDKLTDKPQVSGLYRDLEVAFHPLDLVGKALPALAFVQAEPDLGHLKQPLTKVGVAVGMLISRPALHDTIRCTRCCVFVNTLARTSTTRSSSARLCERITTRARELPFGINPPEWRRPGVVTPDSGVALRVIYSP